MEKRWIYKKGDAELRELLQQELGVSFVTAQLLINRNITSLEEADAFLKCHLSSLHNPYLLKDMDKAVARIRQAVRHKEKVVIYGDYDVDGICAVALLVTVLRELGAAIAYYIPNRLEEGYGLNKTAIKKAKDNGASLIVTVDCGITAVKEVAYARKLGIEVIITDHHELGDSIPDAYAVINPLQPDCGYPFKHLAGVGLAYKLAAALTEKESMRVADHLDFVALGSIADIVPQIGENRIMTRHGLKEMNRTAKTGLQALMSVSGLSGREILSGHVGFILGPRINASGRIGSPEISVRLLLTDDEREAEELAQKLDTENRFRQKLENKILQDVLGKVEQEIDFEKDKAIVLASQDWHKGVIGIVASRLIERYYRPTILIAVAKGVGKGSGRSIAGFHLFEAVKACSALLGNFGGHEGACGLTIDGKKIPEFREKFNDVVSGMLTAELLRPKLEIDMEIPLSALNSKMIYEIEGLSPFGPWNPKPVLSSRNLKVKQSPQRIGKNGLKVWVTDTKLTCEAVGFRMAESHLSRISSDTVDMVYSPEVNTWKGLNAIQLNLYDIKNSNASKNIR